MCADEEVLLLLGPGQRSKFVPSSQIPTPHRSTNPLFLSPNVPRSDEEPHPTARPTRIRVCENERGGIGRREKGGFTRGGSWEEGDEMGEGKGGGNEGVGNFLFCS